MPQRQLSQPILIEGKTTRALQPIPLGELSHNEDWLQELLFQHPEILPVHEIEPIFEGLLPVARELPTARGPLDLLFVNTDGYLTLVETKLWRNPEARRQVIAQMIDYATDIGRWSYQKLIDAVKSATKDSDRDPLLKLARGASPDLDEAAYIDTVSRSLANARFLLLLVGDGIHEGVEHMTEFIQRTPHLGFTLGLVELSLYRVEGGPKETLLIQPRTMARTKEITRAVIEIRTHEPGIKAEVRIPEERAVAASSTNKITQDEFIKSLGTPASKELMNWVIENATAHRVRLHWGKHSASLFYDESQSGYSFGLGLLITDEGASFYLLYTHCKKLGLPDKIWKDYLDGIVALIPGAYRKHFKTEKLEFEQVCYRDDEHHIPFEKLAPKKEKWFELIDNAIIAIDEAMADRASH